MSKKRFTNLDQIENTKTMQDLLRWRKERKTKTKDLSFTVPQEDSALIIKDGLKQDEGTALTWIGHSTFWIQLNGLQILTDPVWSTRMGFDKRLSEPGIAIEKLPEIDLVLISHSHYDHLSFSTLRKLPGNPLYLVPEGLKSLFLKKGFQRVQELKVWEKTQVKDLPITFVPAQHWTKRSLFDTNTSHWGGYVMEGEQTVYFAGDSGYFRGFKEIGEQFEIDYALLPIGAYEPEWFMSIGHVSPEEAIQAYLDTRSRCFIPMHYGTYRLADDTPKEALIRLLAEWNRLQLDRSQLQILPIGGTVRSKNRNEYQEPQWVKDLWQTVESFPLPEAESQQ